MSEKELDNIFKSKLRNRQFEFNPENWKAMEQILDKSSATTPFYWRSTAAILSFGLLVFIALNIFESPVARDSNNGINNISNNKEVIQPDNASEITPSLNNDIDTDEESTVSGNPVSGVNENDPSRNLQLNPDQNIPINTVNTPAAGNQYNLLNKGKNVASQSYGESTATTFSENEAMAVLNSEAVSPEISSDDGRLIHLNKPGLPQLLDFNDRRLLENFAHDPYIFQQYRQQEEWWVSAGPNFSPASSQTGMAAAWFAEINYHYNFSKKWGWETGVGYFARNSPDINWSSDSIFYNFGQEVIRTEVENKRLDYINVPLKISYNLNERHQFNAGIYTAILINVQRNVKQTHIHFKGDTKVNELKENGLSENFRNIDYGFGLGYLYQYTPQLGMGIQLQTGLTDITQDKPGVLSDFHRNINTRLVLRYRLF